MAISIPIWIVLFIELKLKIDGLEFVNSTPSTWKRLNGTNPSPNTNVEKRFELVEFGAIFEYNSKWIDEIYGLYTFKIPILNWSGFFQ